jgi:hypothetical protein
MAKPFSGLDRSPALLPKGVCSGFRLKALPFLN